MWYVVSICVVGRELYLLRIERMYVYQNHLMLYYKEEVQALSLLSISPQILPVKYFDLEIPVFFLFFLFFDLFYF